MEKTGRAYDERHGWLIITPGGSRKKTKQKSLVKHTHTTYVVLSLPRILSISKIEMKGQVCHCLSSA